MKKKKEIIGYQVEDNFGQHNLHPDMDASFCVYNYSQCVEMLEKSKKYDWIIVTIYKGDIEKPTMMF
jgi:hypothetical protein